MKTLLPGLQVIALATLLLLAVAGESPAQEAITAKLEPSGRVVILSGSKELAVLELNAHGAQWKHAPQTTATAQVSNLPEQAGKQFVGSLPIPGTEGALRFTQKVRPLPQGLVLEYDVSLTAPLKLNGLYFSLLLSVGAYGGKDVLITHPDSYPRLITLPQEQPKQNFSLWSGEGARLEVAQGKSEALTLELRAVTDMTIQDLRQWEHQVFEIRLPAFQEEGRELTAEDRFHLDLNFTCAAPLKLTGP